MAMTDERRPAYERQVACEDDAQQQHNDNMDLAEGGQVENERSKTATGEIHGKTQEITTIIGEKPFAAWGPQAVDAYEMTFNNYISRDKGELDQATRPLFDDYRRDEGTAVWDLPPNNERAAEYYNEQAEAHKAAMLAGDEVARQVAYIDYEHEREEKAQLPQSGNSQSGGNQRKQRQGGQSQRGKKQTRGRPDLPYNKPTGSDFRDNRKQREYPASWREKRDDKALKAIEQAANTMIERLDREAFRRLRDQADEAMRYPEGALNRHELNEASSDRPYNASTKAGLLFIILKLVTIVASADAGTTDLSAWQAIWPNSQDMERLIGAANQFNPNDRMVVARMHNLTVEQLAEVAPRTSAHRPGVRRTNQSDDEYHAIQEGWIATAMEEADIKRIAIAVQEFGHQRIGDTTLRRGASNGLQMMFDSQESEDDVPRASREWAAYNTYLASLVMPILNARKRSEFRPNNITTTEALLPAEWITPPMLQLTCPNIILNGTTHFHVTLSTRKRVAGDRLDSRTRKRWLPLRQVYSRYYGGTSAPIIDERLHTYWNINRLMGQNVTKQQTADAVRGRQSTIRIAGNASHWRGSARFEALPLDAYRDYEIRVTTLIGDRVPTFDPRNPPRICRFRYHQSVSRYPPRLVQWAVLSFYNRTVSRVVAGEICPASAKAIVGRAKLLDRSARSPRMELYALATMNIPWYYELNSTDENLLYDKEDVWNGKEARAVGRARSLDKGELITNLRDIPLTARQGICKRTEKVIRDIGISWSEEGGLNRSRVRKQSLYDAVWSIFGNLLGVGAETDVVNQQNSTNGTHSHRERNGEQSKRAKVQNDTARAEHTPDSSSRETGENGDRTAQEENGKSHRRNRERVEASYPTRVVHRLCHPPIFICTEIGNRATCRCTFNRRPACYVTCRHFGDHQRCQCVNPTARQTNVGTAEAVEEFRQRLAEVVRQVERSRNETAHSTQRPHNGEAEVVQETTSSTIITSTKNTREPMADESNVVEESGIRDEQRKTGEEEVQKEGTANATWLDGEVDGTVLEETTTSQVVESITQQTTLEPKARVVEEAIHTTTVEPATKGVESVTHPTTARPTKTLVKSGLSAASNAEDAEVKGTETEQKEETLEVENEGLSVRKAVEETMEKIVELTRTDNISVGEDRNGERSGDGVERPSEQEKSEQIIAVAEEVTTAASQTTTTADMQQNRVNAAMNRMRGIGSARNPWSSRRNRLQWRLPAVKKQRRTRRQAEDQLHTREENSRAAELAETELEAVARIDAGTEIAELNSSQLGASEENSSVSTGDDSESLVGGNNTSSINPASTIWITKALPENGEGSAIRKDITFDVSLQGQRKFREVLIENEDPSFLPADLQHLFIPDQTEVPAVLEYSAVDTYIRKDRITLTRAVIELQWLHKFAVAYSAIDTDEPAAEHALAITISTYARVCGWQTLFGVMDLAIELGIAAREWRNSQLLERPIRDTLKQVELKVNTIRRMPESQYIGTEHRKSIERLRRERPEAFRSARQAQSEPQTTSMRPVVPTTRRMEETANGNRTEATSSVFDMLWQLPRNAIVMGANATWSWAKNGVEWMWQYVKLGLIIVGVLVVSGCAARMGWTKWCGNQNGAIAAVQRHDVSPEPVAAIGLTATTSAPRIVLQTPERCTDPRCARRRSRGTQGLWEKGLWNRRRLNRRTDEQRLADHVSIRLERMAERARPSAPPETRSSRHNESFCCQYHRFTGGRCQAVSDIETGEVERQNLLPPPYAKTAKNNPTGSMNPSLYLFGAPRNKGESPT